MSSYLARGTRMLEKAYRLT